MNQSQKVKQKLEGRKLLSRDEEFYSQTMTTRALQETGITGTVTNINIENKFVFLGRKKNLSNKAVFCSSTFKSRNELHEYVKDYNDSILYSSYAVCYQPNIKIEIKLDSGKTGHISFAHTRSEKSNDFKFINKLFSLCGNSFYNVNNKEITVIYEPKSNSSGLFKLPFKDDKIKSQRRFFDSELDDNNNDDIINNWMQYLRENSDGWIKTKIKNVYTDGSEISLLVETPTNETVFTVEFTSNKNSKFWNIVENVGCGDPANLKNEPVYISQYHNKFYCDCFDYLTRDVEREWVISSNPPITNKNADTKSNKETYLNRIASKLRL